MIRTCCQNTQNIAYYLWSKSQIQSVFTMYSCVYVQFDLVGTAVMYGMWWFGHGSMPAQPPSMMVKLQTQSNNWFNLHQCQFDSSNVRCSVWKWSKYWSCYFKTHWDSHGSSLQAVIGHCFLHCKEICFLLCH